MKKAKKVAMVLIAFVVVFTMIGLMLPSTWRVERSITIAADPEAIFPYLDNLQNWLEWNPWNTSKDETLEMSYSGPDAGMGAKMAWTSESMGSGTLIITNSAPPTRIEFDMSFEGDRYQARGWFTLEAAGDATRVTWTDEGELGNNPVSRYVGLLYDSMMGPAFEEGLSKLKSVVEAAQTKTPDVDNTTPTS